MAAWGDTDATATAQTWTPMRPYRGRRTFEIVDPLIEPLWTGVRVLAHVHFADVAGASPSVRFMEDSGEDLADELPEITDAVGRSVLARDAVIDGVISHQVGLDGVGAAAIPEVRGSTTNLLMRNSAELDVVPRGAAAQRQAELDGFIAFDLLSLDGTELLDVPLLERKRLLESVIEQSTLVRVSIHVRPPLDAWVSTWKSLGLRGAILKAANSRYRPGTDTTEWRLVESVGRRR